MKQNITKTIERLELTLAIAKRRLLNMLGIRDYYDDCADFDLPSDEDIEDAHSEIYDLQNQLTELQLDVFKQQEQDRQTKAEDAALQGQRADGHLFRGGLDSPETSFSFKEEACTSRDKFEGISFCHLPSAICHLPSTEESA